MTTCSAQIWCASSSSGLHAIKFGVKIAIVQQQTTLIQCSVQLVRMDFIQMTLTNLTDFYLCVTEITSARCSSVIYVISETTSGVTLWQVTPKM